jgi:hypothetical protein
MYSEFSATASLYGSFQPTENRQKELSGRRLYRQTTELESIEMVFQNSDRFQSPKLLGKGALDI